jgi:hypothetical protein
MLKDEGGNAHVSISLRQKLGKYSNWRPASERARKSADNQKHQKHDQQQLGDGGCQAGQSKKTHITGDQREDQKRQRPTEHALAPHEV